MGDEELSRDPSPLLRGLGAMLQGTGFAWSLGLTGEDQAAEFVATLTDDLRGETSSTGDGKRITSGFLYLGAEPALAWANACGDHLYPVMRRSIESFDQRWCSVRAGLGKEPFHYVSLGPGDGQKDAVILHDLRQDNAGLCYVPVDMSMEILQLGVRTQTRRLKLCCSRILSVQLDFSSRDNVAELKRVFDGLFGEEAILFSLLGNTVANFPNDAELLGMLTRQLLRPQDKFLLEVATTRQLDEMLARKAAEEYKNSRAFREFATSALMHHTDLQIDIDGDSLIFRGGVEGERALFMRIIYQNKTGREIRVTLPDRTHVSFPSEDTIHLCISRKYARQYLDSLLAASGVHEVVNSRLDFGSAHHGSQFGMDLLLLAEGAEPAPPERSVPTEIWDKTA